MEIMGLFYLFCWICSNSLILSLFREGQFTYSVFALFGDRLKERCNNVHLFVPFFFCLFYIILTCFLNDKEKVRENKLLHLSSSLRLKTKFNTP